MSPNWHVYLCLDGITKNTLDCTYRRIVGQLPCFVNSHSTHLDSISKVFMSGVMVIFQVTLLYLADWYVCFNLAVSLRQRFASYDTYASSAQAGQSLSRTSAAFATFHCVLIHTHWSVRRKYDGFGIPAVHPQNVCHDDLQMGAHALCHSCPRDGPHTFRTSKLSSLGSPSRLACAVSGDKRRKLISKYRSSGG